MDKYPLTWPQGWNRTLAHFRIRAKFSTKRYSTSGYGQQIGVGEGVRRVLEQLRAFGVVDGDAIISSNLKVRLDGLPRADQPEPEDPGVAVYWERPHDKGTKCMAIDIYDRVADNLAAIAATLEAMRAIERHGGAAILDRAFTGFTALPPPMATGRPWRDVLGVGPGESGVQVVQSAYRRKRGETHPDRQAGTTGAFIAVQQAYEQAARELGFQP